MLGEVVLEEPADDIFGVPVVAGGERDSRRFGEPAGLPFDAAADGPSEDSGSLGRESGAELGVLFTLRYRHIEREDSDSSPDAVVGGDHGGSVVRSEPDCVGRVEVE